MKNLITYTIAALLLIATVKSTNAQYNQGFESGFYPANFSGNGFTQSGEKYKSGSYSAKSASNSNPGSKNYLVMENLTFGTNVSVSFSYTSEIGKSATLLIYIKRISSDVEDSSFIGKLSASCDRWNTYEIIIPEKFENSNGNFIYLMVEQESNSSLSENYVYIDDITSDSPLPVLMESFTFTKKLSDVTLYWKTTYEQNNRGFEIERLTNNNWNNIGFISANSTKSYSYTDNRLQPGKYTYRLKQIDYNGNYEIFNLNSIITIENPTKYTLSQNYPNPFNPSTTIEFSLAQSGKVSLKIYDVTGREFSTELNNMQLEAGNHQIKFDRCNLSSGVYFYTLYVNGKSIDTKKMVLTK